MPDTQERRNNCKSVLKNLRLWAGSSHLLFWDSNPGCQIQSLKCWSTTLNSSLAQQEGAQTLLLAIMKSNAPFSGF